MFFIGRKVSWLLLVSSMFLLLALAQTSVTADDAATGEARVSAEYSAAFEAALIDNDVSVVANCGPDCAYPNANSPLGTNLFPPVDYSPIYPFVDAFKTSRGWITQKNGVWDTKEQDDLNLDANGWPKSLPASNDYSVQYRWVSTILFNSIGDHYPSGYYTVLYDGEGTIEYGQDAVKQDDLSSPGKDIIDVSPTATGAGILLRITETDPNNNGRYIRNLRVLMPGYNAQTEEANLFHPHFLQYVEKYKVLRFMDWQRTNYEHSYSALSVDATGRAANEPEIVAVHPPERNVNPITRKSGLTDPPNWVNRPRVTDAQYSSEEGVPLEIMVDLANLTNADPWFNMPHLASDSYIYNFAQMVKTQLGPNQRVYVEYSNEAWNFGFAQGGWMEDQGKQEWAGSDASDYAKRLNWFGKRSAETCNIWESVWADQSDRIICVIATQAANDYNGEQAVDCPLWANGPCYDHNVDAVAIAPYFGQHVGNPLAYSHVQPWSAAGNSGLNNLFKEIEYGNAMPAVNNLYKGSLVEVFGYIENYATLADDRGIDMVAYEGGQHLAPFGASQNNIPIVEMFSQANRDNRMGTLYTKYLTHWFAEEGHMFVHFTNMSPFDKWGNWGAQEYYDGPYLPKYNALVNFMAANACDWPACYAAGTAGSATPTPVATATPSIITTQPSTPTATPPLATPTKQPATATPMPAAIPAALYLPDAARSPDGQEMLPVHLDTAGHSINTIGFLLEYDASQIHFNDEDSDNDGIPDDILFNMPAGFTPIVKHTLVATIGRITVELAAPSSRNATLSSAPIMYILLDVGPTGKGITLSQLASNAGSAEQNCLSGAQTVPCLAEGTAYRTAGGPTSVSMNERSTLLVSSIRNHWVMIIGGFALVFITARSLTKE